MCVCVRGQQRCACAAAGEPLGERVGAVEEYFSSQKSAETAEQGLYFNGSVTKMAAIRCLFYTHYRNLTNTSCQALSFPPQYLSISFPVYGGAPLYSELVLCSSYLSASLVALQISFFLALSCHILSLGSCVVSNIRSCRLDLSKCFTNRHSPFNHRRLGPACWEPEPSKRYEDAPPAAIWASASPSETLDREIMHLRQWTTQTCRMLIFFFSFFFLTAIYQHLF